MGNLTISKGEHGDPHAELDYTSWFWLLPVLAADAPISPEIDDKLTAVAMAARGGNLAARDALFVSLQHKLLRSVRRCYRWSRWQSPAWDRDDLGQESFLIFAWLLATWPGVGSFSAYFFSRFPHRLHDTVRRASGFRPSCPPPTTSRPRQSDPKLLDEAALALLESLAAELPPCQAELLRLHIRDHLSFQEIARRQGCHALTVRRHWHALLPVLRQLLDTKDVP